MAWFKVSDLSLTLDEYMTLTCKNFRISNCYSTNFYGSRSHLQAQCRQRGLYKLIKICNADWKLKLASFEGEGSDTFRMQSNRKIGRIYKFGIRILQSTYRIKDPHEKEITKPFFFYSFTVKML